MQVSVETLKGLERKLTISVPSAKVEQEVSLRLRNLARKAKIDGFRPGKVPLDVVKKRYTDSVLAEVAREMVQSTLFEALKDKELVPAGQPSVEPEQIESGKDFRYTAVFEVYPEFDVVELGDAEIEVVSSDVKESDVDDMLEKLREQNKEWHEVTRAIQDGDKAVIDFEGFLGDTAFEGGKGQDHELVIGSNSMIPGFESGLIGAEAGKELDIKVKFPDDYGHKDLAGQDAVFKVKVNQVLEGKMPELDDALAEKFNITEGGIEALRKDISDNMTRELERRVSSMNREFIFDKLLQKNSFELPASLIDQEIEHLKHEMFHRVFGTEHKENEQIPDFPRSLFEEQAKRRVHLGLMFSEYVKKHSLSANKASVDAMIEKLASAYESPDELRAWYQGSKERLAEIEALVLEEVVADRIIKDAKIVNKTMNYADVMNPKKDQQGA